MKSKLATRETEPGSGLPDHCFDVVLVIPRVMPAEAVRQALAEVLPDQHATSAEELQ